MFLCVLRYDGNDEAARELYGCGDSNVIANPLSVRKHIMVLSYVMHDDGDVVNLLPINGLEESSDENEDDERSGNNFCIIPTKASPAVPYAGTTRF